jgi:uncharacterized protein YhhL (DUF1145 family)
MIMMIVVLVVIGFCLYLLETYVPMSPPIQMLVRAAVVLFGILWILSALGLINIPVNLR